MEDVIGERADPARFAGFLANRRAILAKRVPEAVDLLAGGDGLAGLVLAGSIGWGEDWSRSGLDLLPIFEPGRAYVPHHEIERVRPALLPRWTSGG